MALKTEKYLDVTGAQNDSSYASIFYLNEPGVDITVTSVTKIPSTGTIILAAIDLQAAKQKEFIGRQNGYGRLKVDGLLNMRNTIHGAAVVACLAPSPTTDLTSVVNLFPSKIDRIARDGIISLRGISYEQSKNYRYCIIGLIGITTTSGIVYQRLNISLDWIDTLKVSPYIPLSKASFNNAVGEILGNTEIGVSSISLFSPAIQADSAIIEILATDIPEYYWEDRKGGKGKIKITNWDAYKDTFSWMESLTLHLAVYTRDTKTWNIITTFPTDGEYDLPELRDFNPLPTIAQENKVGLVIKNSPQGYTLSGINLAFELWYEPGPSESDLHSYANFGQASTTMPSTELIEDKVIILNDISHSGGDEYTNFDIARLETTKILPEYLDRTGGYAVLEVSGMAGIKNAAGNTQVSLDIVLYKGVASIYDVLTTNGVTTISEDGTYGLRGLSKSDISEKNSIKIYLKNILDPITDQSVFLVLKFWWVVTDLPDITPPFVNMSKMSVNGYPVIGDTDGDTGVIVTSYRINNNDTNVPLATLFKEDIDPKYIKAGPGWLVVSGLKGFVDTGLIDGIDLVTFHLTSGTSGAVMTKKSLLSGTITKDGVYKVSQIDEVPEHGEGEYSGITFLIPSLKKGESALGSRLVLRLFKEYNSPYQPYINLKDVEYVIPPTPSLPLNNKMFIFAGGPAGQSFEMMNLAFSKILENYKGRSGKGRLIVKGLDNVIAIEKQGKIVVSSIIGDSMFFNPTRDDLYELSSIPSTGGDNFRVMYSRAPGSWNSADPALLSDIIFMYFDFIPDGSGDSEVKNLRIGDTVPDSIVLGNDTTNPWKNEIWEAYLGDNLVWRKQKTFENCWLKWGVVEKISEEVGDRYKLANSGRTGKLELPEIADLEKWISDDTRYITWNCPIENDVIWNKVISWYGQNDITNRNGVNNLFTGSDLPAGLYLFTINFPDSISHPYGWGNYMMGPWMNDKMEYVNLVWKSGATRSIGQIFSGATGLFQFTVDYSKSLYSRTDAYRNTTGDEAFGLCPVELQGTFSGTACNKFGHKTAPGIIWLWSVSDCPGLFLGNSEIQRWADYGKKSSDAITHPETMGNTLRVNSRNKNGQTWVLTSKTEGRTWSLTGGGTADRMFDGCTNLTSIGPIINVSLSAPPGRMFAGCTKLTDLRLNGINNGDWHFGNSDYPLENLDQASVTYLLSNATDLHKYDPLDKWKTGISQDHGYINIPPEWFDKVTDTQILELRKKGWNVLKDGLQYIPSSVTSISGTLTVKDYTSDTTTGTVMEIWLTQPCKESISVNIPIKNKATGTTGVTSIRIPSGSAHGESITTDGYKVECTENTGSGLNVLVSATDPISYNVTYPDGVKKVTVNYHISFNNFSSVSQNERLYLYFIDSMNREVSICNYLGGNISAGSSTLSRNGVTSPNIPGSSFTVIKYKAVTTGHYGDGYTVTVTATIKELGQGGVVPTNIVNDNFPAYSATGFIADVLNVYTLFAGKSYDVYVNVDFLNPM